MDLCQDLCGTVGANISFFILILNYASIAFTVSGITLFICLIPSIKEHYIQSRQNQFDPGMIPDMISQTVGQIFPKNMNPSLKGLKRK